MIGSTVSHNFNLQSAAEPANPEATHAISYIHICTLVAPHPQEYTCECTYKRL